MKYARVSFLIFLLLKPYYIFGSGGLQFADIFLILSAIIALSLLFLNRRSNSSAKSVIRDNRFFVIFTFLAIAINVCYFVTLGKASFLLSSSYLIFNLVAVTLFSYLSRDKSFLSRISSIFEIHLVVQTIIFLLGIGRMYDETRYMGTMNDPNQFGFFVFITFLYIYVIRHWLNARSTRTLLALVLALFLIALSGSTGMILGIGFFVVAILCYAFLQIGRTRYSTIQRIAYICSIAITSFIFIIMPAWSLVRGESSISEVLSEQVIIERISNKASSGGTTNGLTFWEDRGYDKLYLYPQYILFGAGQGEYSRFVKAAMPLEVHATLPAILFVYGFIPCGILIIWIYRRLKDAPVYAKVALIALIVESFTLLNQRQSLFWMFVVLVGGVSRATATDLSDKCLLEKNS